MRCFVHSLPQLGEVLGQAAGLPLVRVAAAAVPESAVPLAVVVVPDALVLEPQDAAGELATICARKIAVLSNIFSLCLLMGS